MTQPRPPLCVDVATLITTYLPKDRFISAIGDDNGSFSGARLERYSDASPSEADGPAATRSYILKDLYPATGWQQRVTADWQFREIKLTQSPLWDAMPTSIWSPVVGCALEAEHGALLMADLHDSVYSAHRCYAPVDNDILLWIIDRLADLHAAFWNHTALLAADWLTSPADALLFMTPEQLARIDDQEDSYGNQARRMWPYVWRLLGAETVKVLWRCLAHPERMVAAAEAAPRTLVHGDAWLANIGVHEGKMALLDWALATAGPAPYDSLWLAFTWQAADPDVTLFEHRSALLSRGVTAVRDNVLWELLCDLAWVRTFYTGAEWLVRDVRGASTDSAEQQARARLTFWGDRAASIIQSRGW